MKRYMTLKTNMGHKIRVRMSDEEIAGRTLYRIAIVTLPFLASAGMFLLWVKMG